jgi:hypothetical protein
MNKKNIIWVVSIIFFYTLAWYINTQDHKRVSESTKQNLTTYTDKTNTFSFSYPNEFLFSLGSGEYGQDWRVGSDDSGYQLAVVYIPKEFLPGTNFSEAKFTVGSSANAAAVKQCLTSERWNEGDVMKVKIGDREFTRITYGDAAAGNYYETQTYRAIHDNLCYAVEYTIHSTNIYNYPPEQGIKEFDKQKVVSILESMVQSFRFK